MIGIKRLGLGSDDTFDLKNPKKQSTKWFFFSIL